MQTLFYGVFSAWVLWHRSGPPADERFTWHKAAWVLKVPMVSKLFEQISVPSIMRVLGVEEIMDWTDDALARVDRKHFFARFEESKAVQYFYEPFLEHFDATLREQYGVWYTPPEVVEYMVERVDWMLVTEFNLERGLADERVVVLDPCVGTGSYLIAVLNKIAERLPDDGLAAQDLKTAARTRIFGFEVLPAPFVVAHLQLGLLLARRGAPLEDSDRVAVYLTNSLTGWHDEGSHPLPFPEFEAEREAAHSVKRDARIVVVLGNPPYYPRPSFSSAEEADLIEPYKKGISTRHSLNDLYVRFFRVAERRIVEGTGYGIVCFITNFSYLHEPGFAEMRRTLLGDFDDIFIDCLNGDSRETGKLTPDGKPDPSIFSTSFNRQGIQVGTAIGTYVRRSPHGNGASVRYRDFWGADKRQQLLESATDDREDYVPVQLTEVNRMAFRPGRFGLDYKSWPQVVEFAAVQPSLGLNENRASTLIDPDEKALEARMRLYLDSKTKWDQLEGTEAEPLTYAWARFKPKETRDQLLKVGFRQDAIVRFVSRPLDVQWAYVDTTDKLWNENRGDLKDHAQPGNWFLVVRRRAPRADDGAAMLPASCLGDQHVLHKDAYFVPIKRYSLSSQQTGEGQDGLFAVAPQLNLSDKAVAYLTGLGLEEASPNYADLIWWHALAISYAPQYLADNPGGIAADWPRIPLPDTSMGLRASADLGRKLAALLDPLMTVSDLPAVIGPIRRIDGTSVRPERGDLEVHAQWGYVQKTAVFPGHGKSVMREYTDSEAASLGDDIEQLGKPLDVYLNNETFWSCIPQRVWDFKIGGFQVLKKWLSYREYGGGPPLLGRSLTPIEARSFSNLAQRLFIVIMLQGELDANYIEICQHPAAWS